MLPERARDIEVASIGAAVHLRAEGLSSGKAHRLILSLDQLADNSIETISQIDANRNTSGSVLRKGA